MLQVLLNKLKFQMKMTIIIVSRVIMAELDLWLPIKRERLAFASVSNAFKLANNNFQEKPIIASGLICKCLASLKSCHELSDENFTCIIKENNVFLCIYFHGNVLLHTNL